jgi:two-component system, response regulator YesN
MDPMRRVLLVDDEPRALSGIRRTFPWETHGFQVVVETTDPLEALRALREDGIDLAFVDIRMPEISGLDLIRTARAEGVKTEFIVVTGFAEFEFARDSLRQGVLDYCLKPVKAEAAAEILSRAEQRMGGHGRDRGAILPADIERNPLVLRDRFPQPSPIFQAVVSLAVDEAPVAGIALPPDARTFRASYGRETVHVLNLESDLRRQPAAIVPAGQRVGIGGACRCLEDIPGSIGQAREALQGVLIHPERSLFPFRPVRLEEVDAIADGVLAAIAEGDLAGLQTLFAALPSRIRERDLTVGDLKHLHNRISAAIFRPTGDGAETDRMEGFYTPAILRAFGDLDGYCCHLARLCMDGQATTGFRAFHQARGNQRLLAILNHVHAHLGEDLSLQGVARRFHFHPNYGSAMFKDTVGVSFSEYVARVRLQKAKRLLLGTSMTLGQIAAEVGYDYYHFIRTFSKREGLSPARFRRAGAVRPEPAA